MMLHQARRAKWSLRWSSVARRGSSLRFWWCRICTGPLHCSMRRSFATVYERFKRRGTRCFCMGFSMQVEAQGKRRCARCLRNGWHRRARRSLPSWIDARRYVGWTMARPFFGMLDFVSTGSWLLRGCLPRGFDRCWPRGRMATPRITFASTTWGAVSRGPVWC